jgi:predicted metal-binding protein
MKDLTAEEYSKVLANVDWFYQRAEGRAYHKGRDTYLKAERLATTPELNEMFQAAKAKKQR